MIFVHGLRDIPKHFATDKGNYYISYSFMSQSVKYQLDLRKTEELDGMLKLKLDKMKIIYFFAESRDNIVDFIKN